VLFCFLVGITFATTRTPGWNFFGGGDTFLFWVLFCIFPGRRWCVAKMEEIPHSLTLDIALLANNRHVKIRTGVNKFQILKF
jgi:hypothetical protein